LLRNNKIHFKNNVRQKNCVFIYLLDDYSKAMIVKQNICDGDSNVFSDSNSGVTSMLAKLTAV
jgi:hypothetical protein